MLMPTLPSSRKTRTARLEIKFENGKYIMPDGGSLPVLREGAVLDLVLNPADVVNLDVRRQLSGEKIIPLSLALTEVWALVENQCELDLSEAIGRQLVRRGMNRLVFVKIDLLGDVSLRVLGGGRVYLSKCKCSVPLLGDHRFESVNESYTKISEKLETLRKSHTGNVFSKVFYLKMEKMVQLEDLRDESLKEPQKGSKAD
jgi:hypothetical protein